MTADYKCRNCENIWEQFTFRDEKPQCPKCSSYKAKRLISAPVIHFGIISDNDLRENEII
jgi:putative FmdB family regulatory protein|tara:strand:+ start:4696 stop:4875 length:180 start_codon:yes stop_codon:yes gene_type:complete